MKIYKTVHLNPGLNSGKMDVKKMEENTNKLVQEGWKLEHVVSPDLSGMVVGFFSKEKDD